MRKKRSRYDYSTDNWPSFAFMHVSFFFVQLFFFWIYFSPNPPSFLEYNIPIIYFRIQEIGYPVVLACSLVWLNRTFFPGEMKHIVISVALFMLEWFGADRWIIH